MYRLSTPSRHPPRRLQQLPPIPISAPVRSSKYPMCAALTNISTVLSPSNSISSSHVAKKLELLVWFEICELAPSGEYVPCIGNLHEICTPKPNRFHEFYNRARYVQFLQLIMETLTLVEENSFYIKEFSVELE